MHPVPESDPAPVLLLCVCKRTYEASEKIKAFFYAQSVSDVDRENILSLK
jgi:hypothetical protein